MNKKAKLVIPVLAGVLAIGTGIGFVAAQSGGSSLRRAEPTYQVRQATNQAGPGATGDDETAYCGGTGMMVGFPGTGLAQAATELGLTTTELGAELKAGKTLAEIAAAKGISKDRLIEALLVPYQQHLEAMVEGGFLTGQQAAEHKDWAAQRVAELVTSDLSKSGTGAPGPGGMMGPGHMDGSAMGGNMMSRGNMMSGGNMMGRW